MPLPPHSLHLVGRRPCRQGSRIVTMVHKQCEHGRRRSRCKERGVVSYASTSMEDLVGYSCDVCKVRECVCPARG